RSASPTARAASPAARALRRPSGLHLHDRGLLRLMRMLRARVDLQLAELLATGSVARQHPLHRKPQHFLGAPLDHLLEPARADSAGEAAVAVVALLLK